MENVPIPEGKFKAPPNDPVWVRVCGRMVTHSFPFREEGETEPWGFPLALSFEGWRPIRNGQELLIVPDDQPWGLA